MNFKIGDYVTRKSYNSDIIFRIEEIKNNDTAYLRSFKLRLMADAPLADLVKIDNQKKKALIKELTMDSYQCMKRQQKHIVLNNNYLRSNKNQNSYREYKTSVLHIDGDKNYLDLSLENYKNLNINVQGFFIPEKGQPEKIREILKKICPDILVITGHDGELNNKKFHTSDFFLKAVKIARQVETDLDRLVIFAGACQSDYERLIASGANYASSPENKLIHFLDPILVVEKVAFTPINEVISVKDVINNTITGQGGVGGIETKGKLRLQYP